MESRKAAKSKAVASPPWRGETDVFAGYVNPFQTNFPVYQKTLCGKTKNLLKTGFMIETKYLNRC